MSNVYVQFPYIPTLNDMLEIPTMASSQMSANLNTSSTLTASYFEKRNLVLSLRATKNLPKPQHAQQMHEMFGAPNDSCYCCSVVRASALKR